MDSQLTQLCDSARQVVDGLGLAADEESSWALMAELGWFMVSAAEELGGLGLGIAGACALHQELGRSLSRVPFLPQMLAIEAVSRSPLAQQDEWLPSMLSGERVVTAALGESSFHLEKNTDGGFRLNGLVQAVPSADSASYLIVESAQHNCVALVGSAQPGMTLMARPTWDVTRRLFDIQADDVVLEKNLVLVEGDASQILIQQLAVLRDFALAADAVGASQALLKLTVEYLQTREQFGRPLALFQALKHRCADLKALTDGADSLLQDNLAAVLDTHGEVVLTVETEMKARATKQLACSAFATVAEESLQLHGGIGMTSEHECHLFLKRALLNEHLGRSQESYDLGLADLFIASTQ